MYLYLGEQTVVREDTVLCVFDIDKATVSAQTREYLKTAQEKGRIVTVSNDIPKSMIVCDDGRVYLSALSPQTLKNRQIIKPMVI